MSVRQKELSHFGDQIHWLGSESARAAYEYALQYDNSQRYGLDPASVRSIERHKIDSTNVALHWVRDRVRDAGSVRVVFGPHEVFVAPTSFFLENWPNFLCPSRDDALILADDENWILFYFHEDELQFGHRAK